MTPSFNLPSDIKLPSLYEVRSCKYSAVPNMDTLDKYVVQLKKRAIRYGAVRNIRSSQPMKYLLSKLIPVHFTAHYVVPMGADGETIDVQRTSKWWGWRDRIYRHYVSA